MPDAPQSDESVKVFHSYSHEDEKLRDMLAKHLSILKRQGVINEWHDRRIGAGRNWAGEIDEHLKSADIILLLVSASFIASDYCYDVELKLAMERREAGKAHVIPIILQPCDWTTAPFGQLQALPKNGRPVTKWRNRAEAFTDIANGIRRVAEELKANRRAPAAHADSTENTQPPSAPPPAPSLIPRPPVVGFVARRDEHGRDIVGRLKQELAPDKSQLIAIWAPPGSGKTTLAAEVARPLRNEYVQRLAWVSALGRIEFGLQTLLDDIATQLGRADLRRLAPDPKAEQVRALLADAPSLVVLDNFETVEPGEQARCVAFLAESTECSALITTRERINRADVKNVRLAAMSMEDAREFWRRMVEQSVRPEAFTELDSDEIIRHCEANPLVIQWVVGQIELAQRPKDALAYLSEGKGDAAERVFDRSFNLPQLGDDGRAALLALSLFTPDASRESLAEVAGFGDNLNRLNEAVRKMSALWLVETTEGNERFFLRALKREMAKSRLSRDAHADDFKRRYVEHFLRYAETHKEPTPENLDALETDKDNVLGAMDAAFVMQDWESVMRICIATRRGLHLRGYWDEVMKSAEQAATAARESNNEDRLIGFRMDLASIHFYRGKNEEAEQIYREALKYYSAVGDERNVVRCLHNLASIAEHTPKKAKKVRWLRKRSLEISRRLGDQDGVALALYGMGISAERKGDLDEARRLYNESLEIRRTLNQQENIATILSQLGKVAMSKGKLGESRQLLGDSLEIQKRLGDQDGVANTLHFLGHVAEKEGDKEEAVRLFREGLDILEKLNSGEVEEARSCLRRAERKLLG